MIDYDDLKSEVDLKFWFLAVCIMGIIIYLGVNNV